MGSNVDAPPKLEDSVRAPAPDLPGDKPRRDKLIAALEVARERRLTPLECANLLMFWIYLQSDGRYPTAEEWSDELVRAAPDWKDTAKRREAIVLLNGCGAL